MKSKSLTNEDRVIMGTDYTHISLTCDILYFYWNGAVFAF